MPTMTNSQEIRSLHTSVAIMSGLGYSSEHCWTIVYIVREASKKVDTSFLDLLENFVKELQRIGVKLSLSAIESLFDNEAG